MTTITEDFVSYEVAKLLKEKEFDEECWYYYHNSKIEHYFKKVTNKGWTTSGNISAPTLQMAMKWLREVHYIHIEAFCPVVDVDSDWFGVTYNVVISNLRNHCLAFNTDIEDNEYDTYEQAVEAAIKYCLKHLI